MTTVVAEQVAAATGDLWLQAPVAAQTILERSVCLLLRCGRQGNSRKVPTADVEIAKRTLGSDAAVALDDEAKGRVSLSERLVAGRRGQRRNALQAANRAVDAVKSYLQARSAGGHGVFGPGTYLLPVAGLRETLATLRTLQAEVVRAAAEVAAQWDALVAERLADPRTLLKAADFPSALEVAEAFHVSWSFVSFAAPERLREVDQAAYDVALADNQAQMADAYQEVVLGLRAAALRVLTELADRLGEGDGGQPKPLRPTALRDLQDLVANLPSLNSIGEDAGLQAALARVQAVSRGLDVETLRKAPAVRGLLLEAAARAAAEIEALGTGAGRQVAVGGLR